MRIVGVKLWNALDHCLKNSKTRCIFSKSYKENVLRSYYYNYHNTVTVLWHCECFRPAVQCIVQRDSLFIHVLFYCNVNFTFLYCAVYMLQSSRVVCLNMYYHYYY